MKNIPQANRTCGLEISTDQTKNSLAAGHQTTANFEHCETLNYDCFSSLFLTSNEADSLIFPNCWRNLAIDSFRY